MSGQDAASFAENVAQCKDFGIPEEICEQILRSQGNDPQRAINYYFSGEYENDKNTNRWDETLFTAGREGNVMNVPTILAPTPQYPNHAERDPEGAKSRRPSPQHQGSFHITPHDNASYMHLESNTRTLVDPADTDYERALKASLEDSGPSQSTSTGPQVTGTVNYTGSANFKLADSSTSYDMSNWAVTTTNAGETSAIEIFMDPPANERKRVMEEPAFLRPGSVPGALGPLLTILHSIPAARETLLQRSFVAPDYGHNEQWWTGHAITLPKIVDTDNPDIISQEATDIIMESQRVMAFLELTERAYGTPEALGSLPNVYEADASVIIGKYFRSLREALQEMHGPEYRSCLDSKAVRTIVGHEPNEQQFQCWDIFVDATAIDTDDSLYDALDQMYWDDDGDGTETYSEYVGDVVTIQVRTNNPQGRPCGVDIPADLYLDRYTEKFKDAMNDVKKKRAEVKIKIEELSNKERKIRTYSNMMQRREYDIMKMLEGAALYFEQTAKQEDLGLERCRTTPEEAKQFEEVSRQLKEIMAKIGKKLDALDAQKVAAREAYDKMKLAFTSPTNSPPDAPRLTKHVLRGVCTDKGTTFIRRRKLIPLINLEDDYAPPETKEAYDWWSMTWNTSRLAYSDEQYGNYEIKTVPEEAVLRAARSEGIPEGQVILVYAREGIDEETPELPIPEPLRIFIQRDNKDFAKEIVESANKPAPNFRKRQHDRVDQGGLDWNPDNQVHYSMNPDYQSQWQAAAHIQPSASSSRAATPGDGESRRNSFSGDLRELEPIPQPPSPPVAPAPIKSVHFPQHPSSDHDIEMDGAGAGPGFRGTYGRHHELAAPSVNHEPVVQNRPNSAGYMENVDGADDKRYSKAGIEGVAHNGGGNNGGGNSGGGSAVVANTSGGSVISLGPVEPKVAGKARFVLE